MLNLNVNGDTALAVSRAVRPEYLRLPGELAALTGSFGVHLSEQTHRDAAVLALAIECIDRSLDSISTRSGRAEFSQALTACLQAAHALNRMPLFSIELFGWMKRLKEMIERRRISDSFCEISNALLRNSEVMRTTRKTTCFVECALAEGALMVELLLLIVGKQTNPQFDAFMRRLGGPANLIDKFRDARLDYARGELAIKPGARFHLRLACEIFGRIPGLAFLCRTNVRLLFWGLKSLLVEIVMARRFVCCPFDPACLSFVHEPSIT